MSDIFARLFSQAVQCPACGRRFKPNLEDRPQPDGGALRLMQCTRCGTEHHVARITPRGVSLMNEIQQLQVSAPGAEKTLKRLQKEMKREVLRP